MDFRVAVTSGASWDGVEIILRALVQTHSRDRPMTTSHIVNRAARLGMFLLVIAVPNAAFAQRRISTPDQMPLRVESVKDTALASLIKAEAEFNYHTEKHRAPAWTSYFTDDAATFPQRGPIATGKKPILEGMSRVLGDTSVHVEWHPIYAELAKSGDLGYTYGYARWMSRDSTGAQRAPTYSKYVTLWRRDATGEWKVVADLGNDAKVPDGFFDAKP